MESYLTLEAHRAEGSAGGLGANNLISMEIERSLELCEHLYIDWKSPVYIDTHYCHIVYIRQRNFGFSDVNELSEILLTFRISQLLYIYYCLILNFIYIA